MFMTKRQREIKKIERVIRSCKTRAHLNTALNMIELFLKKSYYRDIIIIHFITLFTNDNCIHPLFNLWDNKLAQINFENKQKGDNDEDC